MTSSKPLAGRRVLVTRRPEQSGDLVARLEALGAEAVLAPAIEVVGPEDPAPLDAALRALAGYDWLALTSPNGVAFVAQRLRELGIGLGPRPLVASVGPATTRVIQTELARGADLEPESDYQARALARTLLDHGPAGGRLLFPTSDRARETLAVTLSAGGWSVDTVVAYRTCPAAGLARRLEEAGPLDVATFASPSAVSAVVGAAPQLGGRVPCAVIGPVTERAARDAGFEVVVVAQPSTATGLADGIAALWAAKP